MDLGAAKGRCLQSSEQAREGEVDDVVARGDNSALITPKPLKYGFPSNREPKSGRISLMLFVRRLSPQLTFHCVIAGPQAKLNSR
jgi:hypothetical protein